MCNAVNTPRDFWVGLLSAWLNANGHAYWKHRRLSNGIQLGIDL
jgi:hypothetical protein